MPKTVSDIVQKYPYLTKQEIAAIRDRRMHRRKSRSKKKRKFLPPTNREQLPPSELRNRFHERAKKS